MAHKLIETTLRDLKAELVFTSQKKPTELSIGILKQSRRNGKKQELKLPLLQLLQRKNDKRFLCIFAENYLKLFNKISYIYISNFHNIIHFDFSIFTSL